MPGHGNSRLLAACRIVDTARHIIDGFVMG
jgi:hypothetical protein